MLWEYQHIKKQMKKQEAGLIALRILQYKVGRSGLELRPEEVNSKIEKVMRLFGFSRETVTDFVSKHILPHAIRGCGLACDEQETEPTPQHCMIAFETIGGECFSNISNLSNEIRRITSATGLDVKKVSSLAHYVIHKNLRRELGADFVPEPIEG